MPHDKPPKLLRKLGTMTQERRKKIAGDLAKKMKPGTDKIKPRKKHDTPFTRAVEKATKKKFQKRKRP